MYTLTSAQNPQPTSHKVVPVDIHLKPRRFARFQKVMPHIRSTLQKSKNFGMQSQTAMFQTPMVAPTLSKTKVFGTRLVQHTSSHFSNRYLATTRSVSSIFHPIKLTGKQYAQIYSLNTQQAPQILSFLCSLQYLLAF